MNSLRPTSVCDTTPLQRFESSSSEEPSSPSVSSLTGIVGIAHNVDHTSSSVGITATTTATSTTATAIATAAATSTTANAATALSLTNYNNNNKHNNNNNIHSSNKIEINIPNFVNGGVGGATTEVAKMTAHGTCRILLRIGLDLFFLCCLGLPMVGFSIWGEPYERGFFCDDLSLKHPYKESTIRGWMLYFVCLVLPIALIITIEFYKSNSRKVQNFGQTTTNSGYYLGQLELPDWLVECYKKIGVFLFGCFVEQLTTDIAKYSIGRLRPTFLAVCQPIMSDGSTCSDPINAGRYIENFTCLGLNATAKMLKEVRLSFPSGHASFTFFTMIYIAVYLQKRMNWRRTKMLKHLLQFLFLMFAWYTTLTRVSDYKHHWTDVLAGSAIGITYALIVTASMW